MAEAMGVMVGLWEYDEGRIRTMSFILRMKIVVEVLMKMVAGGGQSQA
jgi:hypothetical protein